MSLGTEELVVEQEIEEIFVANNTQKGNTANHHKG
jgi:hypothetical protein